MVSRRILISNSVAVLIRQITQNLTALILTIVIARENGVYALGQYSLAFAFYFVFMTIASNGFKILFTREVARNPEQTNLYLISGSLMQGAVAILSYFAMLILVLMLPYKVDTTEIILVYGLTLIPFALSNTTEAIFQAYNRMYIITYCTVPVYILRLVAMILVITRGGAVLDVAVIQVVSEILVWLLEWGFILRLHRPLRYAVDGAFMRRALAAARTFVAIESISTLRSRIPVIILSLLVGEAATGIFSAAMQLMRPFDLFAGSVVLALFPSMSQASTNNRAGLKTLTNSALSMLMLIAVPMCIAFYFVGGDVLSVLYVDPAFLQAGDVMFVLGLTVLALAIKRPLSYLLMATNFERRNLLIVISGTVVGIALGVLLTQRYQLMGAALAYTVVEIFVALQFGYYVLRDLFTPNISRILLQILPVSLLMIGVFVLLQIAQVAIVPTLLIAGIVYLLAAAFTIITMADGLQMIRARLMGQRV